MNEFLEKYRDKLKKHLKWIVLSFSFFVGSILFFPLQALEGKLSSQISQATRMDVSFKNLRIGLGLRTGFLEGGLLALHMDEFRATTREGKSFSCQQLSLSPQMISILWAQVKAALRCDFPDESNLRASISVFPAWNKDSATLKARMDKLGLENLADLVGGWQGQLSGDLELTNLSAATPSASWSLNGNRIQSPALNSDFLSLPPLDLAQVSSQGTFQRGKLQIQKFQFGDPKGALSGQIDANLGLDPMGLPSSGFIRGKIRSTPSFEQQLSSLNLNALLGPVKASGMREFKKTLQGSPMSLLLNPPEDYN